MPFKVPKMKVTSMQFKKINVLVYKLRLTDQNIGIFISNVNKR